MRKIIFVGIYIFNGSISMYAMYRNFHEINRLKARDLEDNINVLWIENRAHSSEILSNIGEIVAQVYNVAEFKVHKRLCNRVNSIRCINSEKLKLYLLAQTHNYKKLKEELSDESEISLKDLKTLLFFAERKRYFKQFKKIEKDAIKNKSIANQNYQETISLILFLMQKQQHLSNYKEQY